MPRVTISLPTELGFDGVDNPSVADHCRETGAGDDSDARVPVIVRWHACWATGAS